MKQKLIDWFISNPKSEEVFTLPNGELFPSYEAAEKYCNFYNLIKIDGWIECIFREDILPLENLC